MSYLNKYEIHAIVAMAQFEGLKALGYDDDVHVTAAIKLHKDGYYSCPDVNSGFMSPQAAENALSGKASLNTHDHYRSRTKSSEDFFRHYNSGRFTPERLDRAAAWYKSRCRVHTITREENTKLIKYQNDITLKDKHYSFHYKLVGIDELVPRPDLKNKFIFVIEGEAYQNAKEVAEQYNISVATVHSRCKNERFEEWKKIPKKNP